VVKTQKESSKHVVDEVPRSAGGVAGKIQLREDVVATIAGLAARDIPGIHKLGRSRLIAFGDNPRRGVAAEVGQQEVALDLELIIEHGCDIRAVADDLRQRVAAEVDKMTGRKVVEVNLDVVDVHVPGEPEPEPVESRRVR
jgi:uncharacterized alkaline shock family protein YloU